MEKFRQIISKIIKEIPDKERYSEVKYHLRQAIKKLKDKPDTVTEVHKNMAKTSKTTKTSISPVAKIAEATTFKDMMNYLDSMIESEKRKIEEIQKKREEKEQAEEFFTD